MSIVRPFFLCAGIASLLHSPAAGQTSNVTFVPGPASGAAQFGSARSTVSQGGTALGTTISSGINRATLWNPMTPAGIALPNAGFTNTFGSVISDTGIAVGYGQTGTATSGLRWDSSASVTKLDGLTPSSTGAIQVRANAVNASGTAVGYSQTYTSGTTTLLGTRAIRWEAGTSSATVLALAGDNGSGFGNAQARVISPNGIVAGDGDIYNGATTLGSRGILWNQDATVKLTLGAVSTNSGGVGFVEVRAVNDAGVVAGNSRKYSGNTDLGLRAIRWDAGSSTATELGTLGTLATGANVDTTVIAMDVQGNIAGLSQKYVDGAAKGTRPVVWLAGTTAPLELPNLGTDANGMVRGNMSAMNNAGFIAGTIGAFSTDGLFTNLGRQAVIWDLGGGIFNLNDFIDPATGWKLTTATAINDAGWISGYGTFDPDPTNGVATDQYERYFSLQNPAFAVPEPSGALLIAAGATLLARRHRRP